MARTTRQRAAVRAVFQHLDGFHSAQEVHARLRDAGDPVGLSTVYRAVQSLADDGELDSIRTDTGRRSTAGAARSTTTTWSAVAAG